MVLLDSLGLVQTEKRTFPWRLMFISLLALYSVIIVSAEEECFSNARGKNFVIAFPDNYGSRQRVYNLFIFVVSFNPVETRIRLSSKHILSNGSNYVQELTIPPNGYQNIIVPREFEVVGTQRSFKVVEIEANYEISAFAFHSEPYTLDSFLSIPSDDLGTLYVVATYDRNSLFTLIGTKDDTTVAVKLKAGVGFEGKAYSSGDTMTIQLSYLEVVQITSGSDLTGTIITSNKPIAVISGNPCRSTPGAACDVLIDNNIPVTSWGREHFISSPGNQNSFSRYRMIAYYNDTRFSVGGTEIVLESGEFWQNDLRGSGRLRTSKPALLIQILRAISGSYVDPSLVQIPTENQFAYTFGFNTPTHELSSISGYNNYINIVVKSVESENLLLDGDPISRNDSQDPHIISEFNITGTDYALVKVKLRRKEDIYIVSQSSDNYSPMSVMVYGYERYVSYGHSAGMSLPKTDKTTIVAPENARILGGEELTIMLPCLPRNTGDFVVKCKFNPNTIVDGYQIGIGEVGCITPTFTEIGKHAFTVSLNNGTSFPYTGSIYVADQDILPNQIQATPPKNNILIDFRSDQNITLTWNTILFTSSILTLKIFLVKDPIASEFEWDANTILHSNVQNTGSITINLNGISQGVKQEIGDRVTVGTYLLIDSSNVKRQVYITGKRATVVNIADPQFTSGNDICAAFSSLLQNKPSNTVACPCTVQQANADSYFTENNDFISIFHPGTERCFRSAPTISGSCQECCYNSDGNINIGTTSSGTANTFCPEGIKGTLSNQIYDVLPWWACCELSSNCDVYRDNRPSDDCTNYQPSSPGWIWGDPHFRTFDGREFSFNGVGEFTLVSSSLHNFSLQVRMTKLSNSLASVSAGFGIKTDNSSKFQIQRTVSNQAKIYLDDTSILLEPGILPKYLSHGMSVEISQDLTEINIKFITAGLSIKIYVYPNSMACLIPLENRFRGKVMGLLGNYNGEIDDDLMLPNGSHISSSSSTRDIYYNFGQNWRVNVNNSLFTYQSPFTYNTYSDPNFVPLFQTPNVTTVGTEIRQLCGETIPCIFDAVASGSLAFANETIQFYRMANGIVIDIEPVVSCGYPGPILNGSINGTAYLAGVVIEISCDKGFRFNETEEEPYLNSTILSCGLDGNWSAYIPHCVQIHVIPICMQNQQSINNFHSLTLFNPATFRVLGGELLNISLPCLPQNTNLTESAIKCKFGSLGQSGIEVDGYHSGELVVNCITQPFNQIASQSFYVSLDNGTSYIFQGSIYVADQETLPPQLSITQEQNGAIDFSVEQYTMLTWNRTLFNSSLLTLNLFIVVDPQASTLQWDNSITIDTGVQNSGSFQVDFSKYTITRSILSIGTLSLSATPQTNREYITGIRRVVINFEQPQFIGGEGTDTCDTFMSLLQNVPTNTLSCPCTLRQAIADSNYGKITDSSSTINLGGTVRCFRSAASNSGSCQECCYNSDGNINLGTTSSGTANTYCPEGIQGTLSHQIYDVLPRLACCELTSNCQTYTQYRPSDDCINYQSTKPGWAWGDPHYTTFDGFYYDFNGVGEFTLLRSSLYNFTIQGRMARWHSRTRASVYTGFAMQAENSTRFQVQRTTSGQAVIFLNEKTIILEQGILPRYIYPGLTVEIASNLRDVTIRYHESGITIKLSVHSTYMNCLLPLDNRFRRKVEGMLGNFNGDSVDDLLTPNGSYISTTSTTQEIHYNFGILWRVPPNETLFTYLPSFDYDSYNDPAFVPIFEAPDVTEVSDEVRGVCGESVSCIFDAFATGSLELANETVQFETMVQEIVSDTVAVVSCGYPGPILHGSINATSYLAGSVIEVTCNEGYRLNKSANNIPPYEVRSLLSCGMNGTWSQSIPTCVSILIPACPTTFQPNSNSFTLSNISPSNVRVLGGEELAISLSCLPPYFNASESLVKCKFGSGSTTEVPAYHIELGIVGCVTKTFYNIGTNQMFLSIDNGTTFPYHGSVYVADQGTLRPQISLTHDQNDGVIDFRAERFTTITWNRTLFSSSHLTLKLFIVVDPQASTLVWDDSITLDANVLNSGSLTVDLSTYNIARNILSIGTLSLSATTSPNNRVYITGARGVVINFEQPQFIGGDGNDTCDTFMSLLQNVPTNTLSCPCTLRQAIADSNYGEITDSSSTINLGGTVRCFRSAASNSGSCQECCYNSDGNINLGTTSSGTANTYCPEGIQGTLSHQIYDVLPRLACCELTSNCQTYTQYRPSDDCRSYRPTRPGVAHGDPHYITFDGLSYDFNGIGEFTLLRSSLYNFTIQGRMARWHSHTRASVYTGFALQAENATRFQIQRTSSNQPIIFLNEDTFILRQGILLRFVYPGLTVDISPNLKEITIRFLESGITIKLTVQSTYMNCLLPLDNQFRGKVEGMLGNFNGDREDDLKQPNGSYIPSTSSTQYIHYNFGLLWRVPPNDSLFTYQPSFNYESYSDTTFVPIFDVAEVSEEVRGVCGDSAPCIFDAFATGSLELANETVQFETMVQEIVSDTVAVVSCGYPGPILHGSINATSYLAGSVIEVTCNEGYRLNKSANSIPPYEVRSLLSCIMNGTWSQSIPSCIPILIPACANSYTLSNISPRHVRVLGGEPLTISLACLPPYFNTSASLVKCKFDTDTTTEVSGYHIELGRVGCVTKPFFQIGPNSISVSIDNGMTFPYSGSLYVADQETLIPQISLVPEYYNSKIDFSIQRNATMTWNRELFDTSSLTLRLLRVQDPRANSFTWDDTTILLTNVPNTGSTTLDLSQLPVPDDLLTVGTLLLSTSTDGKYITGRRGVIVDSRGQQFIEGGSEICQGFLPQLQSTPTTTLACPCTQRQANADCYFSEISNIFSASSLQSFQCYRSVPSTSGSCQVCCYNADGNINIGTMSSGTANTYCAEGIRSTLSHQIYDAIPRLACCELTSSCQTYTQYRPSDDCARYEPLRNAIASGDPHYTTFDGFYYDFNAIGEFTLLSTSLYNFTIQGRMAKYRYNQASVYTAFAMQADNSTRFQIQRISLNQVVIYLGEDTIPLESGTLPNYLYPGVTVDISRSLQNIQIRYIQSGITVRLTIHSDYMNCLISLDGRFRGRTSGMLGNYNDDSSDDLKLPDGSMISSTSSTRNIHYDFGLSWRVSPNDTLFTYQPSFSYESYSDPTFEPIFEISETAITPEIRTVCGESQPCIFDAVATGDLELANETRQFDIIVDEIVSDTRAVVSCGYPGPISHSSINGTVFLAGSVIEITCNEGYRLNTTSNILPPYQTKSVLLCGINGTWSQSIPSCISILIPACANSYTLSNISPRHVRVLGGEALTIYLPCLPPYFNISRSLAKCKFETGTTIEVSGYHIELGRVGCVTKPFFQIGPNSISVSINNGTTFPYPGSLYVADQETLNPQISLVPEQYNSNIDFSIQRNVSMTWNRELLDASLLTLRLLRVQEPRANTLVWDDATILLTNVPNTGSKTLDLSQLHVPNDLLTMGTLALSERSSGIYITGRRAVIVNSQGPHFIGGGNEICQGFLPKLQNIPTTTLACPCKQRQANADSNFKEISITFSTSSPQPVQCYRSVPSTSGSCQVCCYNVDGNINIGTMSSGSANTYCAEGIRSTLSHQIYDAIPRLACCELTSNCQTYTQYRPSDDCAHYVPLRNAIASGDPHYTTFDGFYYDFNAIGEFTLLSTSLYNFTIQGRMSKYRFNQASVYTAFVMQADNSTRFQIQRISPYQVVIYLGEDTIPLQSGILSNYLYPGVTVDILSLQNIQIRYIESGITVRLTIHSEYMSSLITLHDRFRGRITGMLGNYNDDSSDDLELPDGSHIPSTSSTRNIHYDFGLFWRVPPNDSLFTYPPSLSYESFSDPTFEPIFDISESAITPEIRTVCGESQPCIFDAVATGNLELANETRQFDIMVDEIVADTRAVVSCGYPGPIPHATINGAVFLANSVIEITCNEDYRLNKTSNSFPPYETTSVLSCNVNGTWSSSIPSCIPILIPGCTTQSNTITNIAPRNLRVLGGEALSIHLPCLPLYFNTNASLVKCKFGSFPDTLMVMNGYQIELGIVGCPTPPFPRVGLYPVSLSLNNGTTYSYQGNVYIADQKTLSPQILLAPEENNALLDFRHVQTLTLSWNRTLFNSSSLTLNLLLVTNPYDNTPVWDHSLVLQHNVQNTGSLRFNTTTITQWTYHLTVGTFSLSTSPTSEVYITGTRAVIINSMEPQQIGVGDNVCQRFLPRLQDVPRNIIPCPCTLSQANADSNYIESTNELIPSQNIVRCFRSIQSNSGSCQECCYNQDGNINIGTTSSGAANTFCPEGIQGTLSHQIYDILPRFACCELTSNCATYTQYRPSDDCISYRPTRPGWAWGDPHYTTFDGFKYDFNSIGEFTLLKSSLYNFTIQGRMAKWHSNSRASVYTGFAIQAENASRFQIQRTQYNQAIISIDDDTFILERGILLRHLYKGVSVEISTNLRYIDLRYIESGISIKLTVESSYMNCLLPLDGKFRAKVEGLLGNFNSDPSDDLRLPNGSFIPSTSSREEIHYNFGLFWHVTPNNSLFTYQPSFDYNTYNDLSFEPIFDLPAVNEISPDIRSVCGESHSCIFDAVATGSLELANETRQFEIMAEDIVSDTRAVVSCGFPGQIPHASINGPGYLAGNVIEITCEEGHRLNTTTNFLPPYDVISVLSCSINGTWSHSIPSCIPIQIPGCPTTQSNSNPHGLYNITPYNVRVLGGEIISVTLPCLPHFLNLTTSHVKCRFGSLTERNTEVNGIHNDLGEIECITPPFFRIGLYSLYLSLDNGTTYPYHDHIYVADQDSLLPQIQVTPEQKNFLIDLRVDQQLTLTWDKTLFNSSSLSLKLFQIRNPLSNLLQWDDSMTIDGHVQNVGTKTVFLSTNTTFVIPPLTLGTFLLTPNGNSAREYITGRRAVLINSVSQSTVGNNDICRTFIPILQNQPSNTLACPCTFRQANADNIFVGINNLYSTLNVGNINCFRSASAPSGSCQECCYNQDGNINIGTPFSGPSNSYCPQSSQGTLSHQIYDILPRLACCELTSNCETYTQYRPSDDCVNYRPTTHGWAWGDPHYTTFDGFKYDFNGIGEFTLIKSSLYNFWIQGRMERYRFNSASVYSGFAVQADNASRFQIQRTQSEQAIIFIENDTFILERGILLRYVYPDLSIEISSNLQVIDVRYIESGISIRITVFSHYMNCLLPLENRFRAKVEGILGNFNGDPADDLKTPNGSLVSTTSSTREIHYNFGLLWRVPPNESLFTYQPSFNYDSYSDPGFVPLFEINDADISPDIRSVCGESHSCIFDAVATGDLELANETRHFEIMAEDIVSDTRAVVSCGFPGHIPHASINGPGYLAGNVIEITCHEGYKLNKTTNILPPYEVSSVLTCGINGTWSSSIPSCVLIPIPSCTTLPRSNLNTHTLSQVIPRNARALGGEALSITLPCLPDYLNISTSTVKCRFGGSNERNTEVIGYHIELGIVGCVTTQFTHIGVHSLYLSLNNGSTYLYHGSIYVADQDTLPPQIHLTPERFNTIIDLRTEQTITLAWNTSLFNSTTLSLKFLRISDPLADTLKWDDTMILNGNVPNIGTTSIILSTQHATMMSPLTLGTLLLSTRISDSKQVYITGNPAVLMKDVEQQINGGDSICTTFLPLLQREPNPSIPCPCTLRQAIADSGYTEVHELYGTVNTKNVRCFQSTASQTGSCQECCYNSDGNINIDTASSGTANTYCPQSTQGTLTHQIYDVLPWWACCELTYNCETYTQYRPSDDCVTYRPTTHGWAWGDPHYTTFDGFKYDFNGIGEFTLIKSSLYNFWIQGRMERYRFNSASVYSGFAIQVDNASRFQIQRTQYNQAIIFIENDTFILERGILLRYVYPGLSIEISSNLQVIDVRYIESGISIRITVFSHYMNCLLPLDNRFRAKVEGILGNFNGDPADDLKTPNGSLVSTTSSTREIHYNFGLLWRVSPNESLFTYQPSFNYDSYSDPGFVPLFEISDNDISPDIRSVCGESHSCIFDAVATGDLELANETRHFEIMAEDIVSDTRAVVSCGFPGHIPHASINGPGYLAGNVIEITCHEGYKLNKTTNILPPYDVTSVLTCSVNGTWSPNVPSCAPILISACATLQFHSNTHSLSNITPRNIRVLGGEALSITLPCLPNHLEINTSLVKCRFNIESQPHVEVYGYHTELGKVVCVTPPISRIGLHSLLVSLDDGMSYLYSGTVYVADQETLLPQITVSPEHHNAIIDFRLEIDYILSWNKSLFNSTQLELKLLYVKDPLASYLDWNDTMIIDTYVQNTGRYALDLTNKTARPTEAQNSITVGAFSLSTKNLEGVDTYITSRRSIVINIREQQFTNFSGICETFTPVLQNIPTNTKACPCTMRQANADNNFVEINDFNGIIHPNTVKCYRSTASSSGSCQECCYNTDGHINIDTTSSGTANTYCPESIQGTLSHQIYDVLPWWACCELTSNCETYTQYRPSDDCVTYRPTKPGWAWGDPHYRTFDGFKYDFNGIGEFTLVKSSLYNFWIQGRMERYRFSPASVYSGFVIQVDNASQFQIQRTQSEQAIIFLDNDTFILERGILLRYVYPGLSVEISQNLQDIDIRYIESGISIKITVLSHYMNCLLPLENQFRRKVEGMLGNFNGDPVDDLMPPNGNFISTTSSTREIHHNFGLLWRILPNESLFTYQPSFNYDSYSDPVFVPLFVISDNDISPEILAVCGESHSCIFDAVATGSLEVANETRQFEMMAEEIVHDTRDIVSCGYPGPILHGSINDSVYLAGNIIEIKCNEGYKLYKTINTLPPYDVKSVLTCGTNGTWSPTVPSCILIIIPACTTQSTSNTPALLDITPRNVRVLGGEALSIELPCLPNYLNLSISMVKCRFGGLTERNTETNGYYIERSLVGCTTSPFFRIGSHSVHVSLNNGSTYPFIGSVYVADEENLPPQISISPNTSDIIDFRFEKKATLTWDKELFNSSLLVLKLFMIKNPLSNDLKWDDNTILNAAVENTGRFLFNTNLTNLTRLLTIGTYLLTESLNRTQDTYITGKLSVVVNTAEPYDVCGSFLPILQNTPNDQIPCPCTTNQANTDINFIQTAAPIEIFDDFNPGPMTHFQSTPSISGSGQQCLYNFDGIIDIGSPSSGTADTYSPESIEGRIKHLIHDELPWWACCNLSSHCDIYQQYRPSDDCSNYQPTTPAWTFGDPHFRSLDGLEYTFNGAGEFTLATSSLHNFTFQARMEQFEDSQASVYTGFAIETVNSTKIQIQRTILGQTIIFADDKSFVLEDGVFSKYFYKGVSIQISNELSQIDIRFTSGVSIRIYVFPESFSYLLQLDDRFKGKIKGLLGNFNGNITDDLMLPNGSYISMNSTLTRIHYNFGLKWRIKESESLFTYQTPFNYGSYDNASFVPILEIPNVNEVSTEVHELCGDSISCLFDATTTGSLSFASETAKFTKITKKIQANSVKIISCGYPGPIVNGSINGSVFFAHHAIEIACKEGFIMNTTSGISYKDKIVLTCGQDGQWSELIPTCILMPIAPTPTVTSHNNLNATQFDLPLKYTILISVIGVLLVITFVIVVFTLIMIILVCMRHRRKHKKDDDQSFEGYSNETYEMTQKK